MGNAATDNKQVIGKVAATSGTTAPNPLTTTTSTTSVPTITVKPGQPSTPEVNGPPPPPTPPTNVQEPAFDKPFSQLVNDWVEANRLNPYHQVAYHFRLFMGSDADPVAGAQTTDQLYRNIDAMSQCTIAETGVTGFNIKDVDFVSVIAQNANTRDQKSTTWTVTIIEPQGVSFIDAMFGAAQTLNVWDYTKMVYWMELTFKAYDENGRFVLNPLADYSNGGKWVWSLVLQDIETKLNEGSATYTLHFVSVDTESVMVPEKAPTQQQSISVHGETLQQMFDDYARQLTEFNRKQYGENHNLSLITYQIDASHLIQTGPGTGQKPGDFKLTKSKPEEQVTRPLTLENDNSATVAAGWTINEFITNAIKSTEEGQALMNLPQPSGQDGGSNGNASSSATRSKQESTLFSIEPDIRITGKEVTFGNYEKTVTYHVVPFFTQTPVMSAAQVAEAKTDPAVQRKMIRNLGDNKLIRRRYDYIFTGLNTEVLDFNLDFKMRWQALLPKFGGARLDYSQVAVGPRYVAATDPTNAPYPDDPLNNTKLEPTATAAQVPVTTTQSTVTAAGAQDMTQNPGLAAAPARDVQRIQDKAASVNVLNKTVNQITSKVAQSALNIVPLTPIATANTTGQRYYMEDVISRLNQGQRLTSEVLPISFTTDYNETSRNAAAGFPGAHGTSDRAMLGALFAQMYSDPVSQSFLQIELSIRGDPYWLGQTNPERQVVLRTHQPTFNPNKLPDYSSNKPAIFVNFRYPTQIGDDFKPILNDSMVFNGLYEVVGVKHSFSDGAFKQTLSANILPLIDLRLAYQSDSGRIPTASGAGSTPGTTSASTPTGGTTPGSGASQIAATGGLPNSATQQARAKESYNFWIGKGYSPAAASGMVAQEEAESGFDWTQTGDGSAAKGAFQWHAPRQAAIRNATGIDVADPTTTHQQQLEAAYWEQTQGSFKTVGSRIRGAQTGGEAGSIATIEYEIPSNKYEKAQIRGGRGQFWQNHFTGKQ